MSYWWLLHLLGQMQVQGLQMHQLQEKAAAPAVLQDVKSVPRTVCAKVKRGPRQRRRNAAAASEDPAPPTQTLEIALGIHGGAWLLSPSLSAYLGM
ncbi:hypothetical protein LEMLEM_LOCUS14665 [Lemmus lemmus]